MVKSKGRISISTLESPVSEKAKYGATLPFRIDVEDSNEPNSQSPNNGLEIACPDEPLPLNPNTSQPPHYRQKIEGVEEVAAGDAIAASFDRR